MLVFNAALHGVVGSSSVSIVIAGHTFLPREKFRKSLAQHSLAEDVTMTEAGAEFPMCAGESRIKRI